MWKFDPRATFLTRAGAVAAASIGFLCAGASGADAQTYLSEQAQSGYHVVAQGDTLWDLSGRFYGDTFEWPRMWSYNAHITNPHWIYPGDIVYLSAQSPAAPQQGQPAPAPSQAPRAAGGLYLPVGGYISSDEAAYIGRIRGSRKGAAMLAEHDSAWVGFGDEAYGEDEKSSMSKDEMRAIRQAEKVKVGDRFSIVREIGTIKDDDGKDIAHKYLVLGVAEVKTLGGDYFDEVEIVQSWEEIYRGDMLVPYERQLKVIKQTPASNDGVGEIIDTIRPGRLFAEHNYVFINKGASDGVRSGNRFFAYQRYEGLHFDAVDGDLDAKVPWTQVGQLLVIDVREHYSTALIIDSRRELDVGDRVEMYSGN